jgi:hypothetical protein
MDEAQYYRRFIATSAVLNYYMWFGLYAVMVNECIGHDDWRACLQGMTEGTAMLTKPEMRAYVISAITGHEMTTLMSPGANLTIDPTPMLHVRQVEVATVHDDSPVGPIKIDRLYAPVSGSLILGSVGGQLDAVKHLLAVQRFDKVGDYGHYMEDTEALAYANLYRLFGHDVVLTRMDGTRVKPWANVKEAVIERGSMFAPDGGITLYRCMSSTARSGRNYPLPHIGNLTQTNATLTIMRPTLSFNKYGNVLSRSSCARNWSAGKRL